MTGIIIRRDRFTPTTDAYEGARPSMTATKTVTMYSTRWCGYCRRLKRQMADEGITFREVDLDSDPSHDDRIVAETGGYRTVPTLEIHGRLLVNPSIGEVRAALAG